LAYILANPCLGHEPKARVATNSIEDSNIFTIVNPRQNFNQIVLVAKDRKKTIFHGNNKLWEWLLMPFGLKNAPIFFQQMMGQIFDGAYFLKCYIDDILVHSKGFLKHLAHLEELFKRLHEVNMKIHPKKCEFVVTLIVYLGHRILPNGIMVHWAKIIVILEMPNPTYGSSNYVITTRFMSKTSILLLILSMHC
jgi:hypothetical protein